jgi:hypothetical protein
MIVTKGKKDMKQDLVYAYQIVLSSIKKIAEYDIPIGLDKYNSYDVNTHEDKMGID